MPYAPDSAWLRDIVESLTAFDRPSASDGEHRAAELIRTQLKMLGADDAHIEVERAHGTYHQPMGLLTAAGAAAGLTSFGGRRARMAGAVFGAAAAAAVWDDITGGRQAARRLLRRRSTYNVVASVGPADADRTLVVVAHHDAARSGLIFNPAIPEAVGRVAPGLIGAGDSSPPLMWPVFAGPALAAIGAALGRRGLALAGTAVSAVAATAFADIARHDTVPGANDNVTGVAALLALARAFAIAPTNRLRVMLVSTGSEESFMEGMQAFARKHFPDLPVDRTFVLCVDTLGSDRLYSLRGEGMLRMYDYPSDAVDLVADVAGTLGVELGHGRLRNATDGLIALKAGYPSATLGSVSQYNAPANYHWPSDTAENVNYGTVAQAVALCEGVARRLDATWLS